MVINHALYRERILTKNDEEFLAKIRVTERETKRPTVERTLTPEHISQSANDSEGQFKA